MTGCCSFPNLGCLQIPTNTTTITGPPGATGAAGANGAAGATGAAGANGTTNLISDSTTSSTATLTSTVIKTGTVPADTLTVVGDALVVKIGFNRASSSSFNLPFDNSYKVRINGQDFFVGGLGAGFIWINSIGDVFFDVRINYLTSTTARCQVSTSGVGFSSGGISPAFGLTYTQTTDLTGLDFTSNQTIDILSKQTVADNISCTGLYADLIKA